MTENNITEKIEIDDTTLKRSEKPTLEQSVTKSLVEINQKNWEKHLKAQNFEGDVVVGVQLVNEATAGFTDLHKAMLKRGMLPSNYDVPPIYLDRKKKTSFEGEFSDRGSGQQKYLWGEVYINTKDVEDLSQMEQGRMLSRNTEGNGESVTHLVGTAGDIMYLAGVEEAAHSVFYQTHPEKSASAKSTTESEPDQNGSIIEKITEYDSQDAEYHGLGWQIRLLKDAQKAGEIDPNKAKQMLKPLEARLQKAIEFRSEQKKVAA